ncbi:MAG: isoamylase early set domain-containing protein [Acidobacteriota bacterium]|nr:isoamylase early set domain-containing protein [Acidobacteriota bacterium]MDQ7088566.1 isoamylase early set domain-containing protein [Acidobacteriota bacterium]
MLRKKPIKGSRMVSVTFSCQVPEAAGSVALAGDFNDWDPSVHPMRRRKDGAWAVTLRLPRDSQYQYRFLVGREQWLTDTEADGLVPNDFGTENALVRL